MDSSLKASLSYSSSRSLQELIYLASPFLNPSCPENVTRFLQARGILDALR